MLQTFLENMHHVPHVINLPNSLFMHSLSYKKKISLIHKRSGNLYFDTQSVNTDIFPVVEPDDLSKKRIKATNPTVTLFMSC